MNKAILPLIASLFLVFVASSVFLYSCRRVPPEVSSDYYYYKPFDINGRVETKYGQQLVYYGKVYKKGSDGTSTYFNKLYIDAASVGKIQTGLNLPDNTLIVMENWANQDSMINVQFRRRISDTWINGEFAPHETSPDFSLVSPINSGCNGCHITFSYKTDFTFTYPIINKALRKGESPITISCSEEPTRPCSNEIYEVH